MKQPEIKVLYDGNCPICSKEVGMLKRRDHKRNGIIFEDIAAPDFDAAVYDLDQDTVMARIHGVLPDGTVVEGLEVFRRAYRAVGLGWLMAPTGWPGLRQLMDACYRVFARNRLRWTGRAKTCSKDLCKERIAPVTRDAASGS